MEPAVETEQLEDQRIFLFFCRLYNWVLQADYDAEMF
jgi:hypothetical protein